MLRRIVRSRAILLSALGVALGGSRVWRGKILGGVVLRKVMSAGSQAAIKGCKDTVSKHFRLSLNPILQGLTFLLTASFIELLGAGSHLSLD